MNTHFALTLSLLLVFNVIDCYSIAKPNEYDKLSTELSKAKAKIQEDSIIKALYPEVKECNYNGSLSKQNTAIIKSMPSYENPIANPILPSNISIDKSKTPDEIEIKSGISVTGGKTYEIPIKTFPGINEFQPNISLVYDSQSGTSAVGQGWSISGIPIITRGGKNLFHDDKCEGIQMNLSDSFYIDGLRLVKKYSKTNYIEYQTEYGDIKARGYIMGNIMLYFDVFYPDGSTARFGYENNKENRIDFPITVIKDIWHNTIKYTYQFTNNDSHVYGLNYYYISKIEYNDSEINFKYKYRDDTIVYYIGGNFVNIKQCLSEISCTHNKINIGTYTFKHSMHNQVSHLSEIGYCSGNEVLNPLQFIYGEGETEYRYKTSETQLLGWYDSDDPNMIKVVRGKFNCDNDDDGIIVLPNYNPYWHTVHYDYTEKFIENRFINLFSGSEKIFLYAGLHEDFADPIPSLKTGNGFVDILCADLVGKREDSVIKINNYVENNLDKVEFTVYQSNQYNGINKTYSRSFSFNTAFQDKTDWSIQPKFYYSGDFNGDGKMEVLAVSATWFYGETYLSTKCYIFDLENNKILYEGSGFSYNVRFTGNWNSEPSENINNSDRLLVFDADGDGKTDICLINNNGLSTYTFDVSQNGEWSLIEIGTSIHPTRAEIVNKDLLLGEFNGDGLIDIITTPQKGNIEKQTEWITYYSRGNGVFLSSISSGPCIEDDSSKGFILQDVDNDGRTDLIKFEGSGFTTYPSKPLCIGNTGFRKEYSLKNSILIPADVNRISKTSKLLSISKGVVTKYSLNVDLGRERMLTGMISSFGLIEKNEYHSLQESGGQGTPYSYTGAGSKFPYIRIRENLMVLSRTESYMNSELCSKSRYQYENAVYHTQGLGFRGFEKTVSYDSHDNETERIYNPYALSTLSSIKSIDKETVYRYNITEDRYKIKKIKLIYSYEKNSLTGFTTTRSYSHDDYGLTTVEDIGYSDGIKIKRDYSYHNVDDIDGSGTYSLGFVTDYTETMTRNGDEYKTRQKYTVHDRRKPLEAVMYINDNQINRTLYSYDVIGNLTQESEIPYSAPGSLVTSYTYFAGSSLSSKTDPYGNTETYSYDSHGRVSGIADHTGVTSVIYDDLGREKVRTYPDSTQRAVIYKWASDSSPGVYEVATKETGKPLVSETYDALGRLVRKSDTRFDGKIRNIDCIYDQFGNLYKESEPFIGACATEWKEYEYDHYGRLEYISEPSGRWKQHNYYGANVRTWEDGKYIDRTYDSLGNLILSTDEAGSVEYDLAADGQPVKVTCPGGIIYWYYYDDFRRQETIVDASAGIIRYQYDSWGNISSRESSGRYIGYSYDNINRLVKVSSPELTTSYVYDSFSRLTDVLSDNGTARHTSFDSYGRIRSELEEGVDGKWLQKDFLYSDGNISEIKYTSQSGELLTEEYSYSNGTFCEGRVDSNVIYRLDSENDRGLTVKYQTGNIANSISYHYVFPTEIKAETEKATIQRITYGYDTSTSNITSRDNLTSGVKDSFGYDALNRLTSSNFRSHTFNSWGNITDISNVGTLGYEIFNKPHALTKITPYDDSVHVNIQEIAYSTFDRPLKISEGEYTAEFTYNADYERVKMYVSGNGPKILTRHYLSGCYEAENRVPGLKFIKERLYLFGGYYDAPAVFIKERTNTGIYYILRDCQGSITHVVESAGNVVQETDYEAWGMTVDVETGEMNDGSFANEPNLFLGRGYTGHEHLPWFGLINMNARLYDPLVGRFLSPDPYIQLPDYTQGFNRFSYAQNNPLRFVDRDGEFFWTFVGVAALIGGVVNVATHWDAVKSGGFWTGASYFLTGAAAGGIGAAVGVGAAVGFGSMLGVTAATYTAATTGFVNGALVGMAEGAVSGFILNTGNSLVEGNGFGKSLVDGVWGAVGGGVSGGIAGGVAGGINAMSQGKNFWTGAERGNYTLYYGFDKQGNVRYVGITRREPEIRFYEHSISNSARADLTFIPQKSNLFRLEARILEQKNINKYGLEKFGGQLFNKRNEISPKLWDIFNIKPSKFK